MQTSSLAPLPEVQRVRGTNDYLPPDASRLHALADRLRGFFELYGYQAIDTPVLEPLELFLRKSGDEMTARMYTFSHWNRRLCLRPELTASVMRAYVNGMQERALPLRLHYAGPTFRYEKPQRGRFRQFTQVGVECIGASGPLADAEILRVACDALQAVGLSGYRLVVGHLGVVLRLLAQLGLSEHAQTLILGAMEHLARRGAEPEAVAERILGLLGFPQPGGNGALGLDEPEAGLLHEFVARFGERGATRVAADLLALGGLPLEGGSRAVEEIVARLLDKAGRADPSPAVRTAIAFIVRLRDLAGPPERALPALEQLLAEHALPTSPLAEIRQALDMFHCYGAAPAEICVDLSLGRGLWYYTGLVFEIYHESAQGSLQLCGGGRYDELVRALGGHDPVPACGFAFGLERVDLALTEDLAQPAVEPATQALVVPLAQEDAPLAIRAAESLRAAGLRVELDVRGLGARGALRRADRTGIPLVVLIGEREREQGVALLRRMRAHAEERVPLDELPAAARRAL